MNLTINIDTSNREELVNLRTMLDSLLGENDEPIAEPIARRNNDWGAMSALIEEMLLVQGPMNLNEIIDSIGEFFGTQDGIRSIPTTNSLNMFFFKNQDKFEFIGAMRTGKYQLK